MYIVLDYTITPVADVGCNNGSLALTYLTNLARLYDLELYYLGYYHVQVLTESVIVPPYLSLGEPPSYHQRIQSRWLFQWNVWRAFHNDQTQH